MSVQQRTRMPAGLDIREPSGQRDLPLNTWLARGAVTAASVTAVAFFMTPDASAVPSFARQTGQPCATCHTAFLELTPFGRQFKLMGYSAGGNRCNDGSAKSDETQVPLALMAIPATYTHVKSTAGKEGWEAPNINNDAWVPAQYSLFVAGQLYCDAGAFVQVTHDPIGNVFTWDNVDVRYAKTTSIAGTSVVLGVTGNNNPTVQDPWNTTAAWRFPYVDSSVAPAPAHGTMLGAGSYGMQVGGVGAYAWINSSIYAELTFYNSLSPRMLANWNGGYDPTAARLDGSAPYWRLAYEKNWDKNSLMVGTFGMYANQRIAGEVTPAGRTDATLDLGVDTQYQWIGERHAVTVRAAYIWEKKKNDVEIALADPAFLPNASDTLNDFNISASYIYNRKYSFTASRFNTWGTADANLYGTASGLPDSSYWKFDLAYLPFMDGGPDLWPWFNARIGIMYTHYDKFNGMTKDVDGFAGLKASGNDTVFIYTWFMF
jgi:hypothetical protein